MIYTFHRDKGFYPIDVPPEQVTANIRANPGTLQVRNHHGEAIWTLGEGWSVLASNKERNGYVKESKS